MYLFFWLSTIWNQRKMHNVVIWMREVGHGFSWERSHIFQRGETSGVGKEIPLLVEPSRPERVAL